MAKRMMTKRKLRELLSNLLTVKTLRYLLAGDEKKAVVV